MPPSCRLRRIAFAHITRRCLKMRKRPLQYGRVKKVTRPPQRVIILYRQTREPRVDQERLLPLNSPVPRRRIPTLTLGLGMRQRTGNGVKHHVQGRMSKISHSQRKARRRARTRLPRPAPHQLHPQSHGPFMVQSF
jgi:hypothetical protein